MPEEKDIHTAFSSLTSTLAEMEKAYSVPREDFNDAASISEVFDIDRSLKTSGTDLESGLSSPFSCSSSSITPILGNDVNLKEDLPAEHPNRLYRWLRWKGFSTYRRLLLLVLLANIGSLAAILSRARLPTPYTLTAVSVNLAVSIVIRDQTVVDLLFLVSCSLPLSAPLWLRRWAAKIYTYGGLHSGCAIAATVWYVVYTILATVEMVLQERPSPIATAVATVNYLILVLLLTITILAVPGLRARFHNTFECTHRYAGWTVLALFWALCILTATSTSSIPTTTSAIGRALIKNPAFWCLILITVCLIHPWLQVRTHPITRVEPLSSHAVRLHFSHTSPSHCTTVRVSDNLLKESHAFACIPYGPCLPTSTSTSPQTLTRTLANITTSTTTPWARPPTTPGFSLLISSAGDWTRALIASPPTHLTFKGRPTLGVLRVATLFKTIVLVATGSGIGPCLSLFTGRPDLKCRVVWTTPGAPEAVFGRQVVRDVRRADPGAVVLDTHELKRRGLGRPDLVGLALGRWNEGPGDGEERPEAVFVISNARITAQVVYGLERRGVPTFAPIFDS